MERQKLKIVIQCYLIKRISNRHNFQRIIVILDPFVRLGEFGPE